jgi:hypothetical protein
MKTILVTTASKISNLTTGINLGINLTTDMNDFYKENYQLLKKEIEEDYRRWKDLLCSWIGRST